MNENVDNLNAPSPVDACHEVVAAWKEKHSITQNVDDNVAMLVGRSNAWIAPISVITGVKDVFGATAKGNSPLNNDVILDLGEMLAKRFSKDSLFRTSPRARSAP